MSAVNNSSYWDWTKNCTYSDDLALPLVPYMDCPTNRKYASYFIPLVFYMLSILGTIGNLWSLWTCLRPSQPWSIGSIGVLNLALCDLAYLASMGPWAVYISSDYHWKIGRSLCIVVKILYFVGLTSSTMFICAISTDRFLAIVFPLESRMIRTPRNSALVSLLLWAITALFIYFSYPNIFYSVRKDGIHVCGAVVISKFRTTEATYNLMSYYSIQVSVPLLLIIPAYVKIISRMKHSRQQWGPGNMQGLDKSIWLIAVFIANFLVCWVPGQLLHIIACIIFFTLDHCKNACWVAWVVNLLSEASQILYCLNACLDPLIFLMQQRHGELPSMAVFANWARKFLPAGKKQDLGGPSEEPTSVIHLHGSSKNRT
ncbi:P2Y purinoceptor 1 [Ctenopharyngodon idella]|uniref:P2Y purinoceptor 1 n=1 Tax=Ctenopharyngodon idella TaxID=7959 RepID=UPI002231A08F|nr:P2Y purinoceptor 1 [Ctenopharyngodon idella]